MKHGIDISTHNGKLDFSKLKKAGVEFLMIRAGYGAGHIDTQAEINCKNAEQYGIPYGLYWFSYALTADQAATEAEACLKFAKDKRVELPIAFDYEYDSEKHGNAAGLPPSPDLMRSMAEAFLTRVEAAGYYAILYSNVDYIKRAFFPLLTRWALWLADWRQGTMPTHPAGYNWKIWQTYDRSLLPGVSGSFDYNIMPDDLLTVCRNLYENRRGDGERVKSIINNLPGEWFAGYMQAAYDTINGKYKNGAERVTRLKQAGFDPVLVQAIVNKLLAK